MKSGSQWHCEGKNVKMIFLIQLTLLLFEFQYIFGHTLPRQEILKNVDIYSVQENNHNGITVVNPKSKKPTVKEIIYYHVIERPYEQSQVMVNHNEETVKGPDFDDTMRPFTNGHGLQFIYLDSDDDADDGESSIETVNSQQENTQSRDEDETDDSRRIEVDHDIESDNGDNETKDEDIYEDDNSSGDHSSDDDEEGETYNTSDKNYDKNERIDKQPVVTSPAKEEKGDSQEPKTSQVTESAEKRSSTEKTVSSEKPKTSKTSTEALLETTEPVATTAVDDVAVSTTAFDDVANEKRAARNLLFNQLRDRYQKSLKPSSGSSRKKRSVNAIKDQGNHDAKEMPEMPEAPILLELNYDQLPAYVREMISTEKPVTLDLDKQNEQTEEEIEHRIEEMINEVMRPYEEEHEETQEEQPTKPRTYGMKLKKKKGYVWNDLWSNPGMSVDVGDTSRLSSEEDSEENEDDQPEYHIEPYEVDISQETQETDDPKPNLKDIFVDMHRENNEDHPNEQMQEYLKNEDYDESKEINERSLDDDKHKHTVKHNYNFQPNESKNEDLGNKKKSNKITQEDVSNHKETTEQSTDEGTKIYYKDIDVDREPLDEEGKTVEDIKQHQLRKIEKIVELFKEHDVGFWTLLKDLTSTYMDILIKRIMKEVQQEVQKQIKLNKNCLDQEKLSREYENSVKPQKHEKETGNAQATGDSITVDGVKIPFTHNTNFENEKGKHNEKSENYLLQRRRHKDTEKDNDSVLELNYVDSELVKSKSDSHDGTEEKSKKEIKERNREAKNIFGSSYNNDKVTNIYIFYPTTDSNKIFDDFNAVKANKNNVFIFGKPEITKGEKREDESTENNKKYIKPIKVESMASTDKNDIMTSPIIPTEEKETLTVTENLNKDENKNDKESENKVTESQNDNKELSEIYIECTTLPSNSDKEDAEVKDTAENNHILVSVASTDNKYELTSPITPTEEKGTLTTIENPNRDEIENNKESENKVIESQNDKKELSEISIKATKLPIKRDKEDAEVKDTNGNNHIVVSVASTDKKKIMTTPITPTEEKETLTTIENPYEDKTEHVKVSEINVRESKNDNKDISENIESTTLPSNKDKEDTEVKDTAENKHNVVESLDKGITEKITLPK